jgi:hypothetical protein
MDLYAAIFGLTLLSLAVGVTYHWGIRPDRQEKKRRGEAARAELRRQHAEEFRKRPTSRTGYQRS